MSSRLHSRLLKAWAAVLLPRTQLWIGRPHFYTSTVTHLFKTNLSLPRIFLWNYSKLSVGLPCPCQNPAFLLSEMSKLLPLDLSVSAFWASASLVLDLNKASQILAIPSRFGSDLVRGVYLHCSPFMPLYLMLLNLSIFKVQAITKNHPLFSSPGT